MADKEQLQALMVEIGPALQLAEVTAFAASDLWTLVIDEHRVLFVDYDLEDGRVWLSAEVGTPPPGDRAKLYERLLQYNGQWQRTGGVRLALDGPEGGIVLAYDLSLEGLDLARLRAVILGLVDKLDAWREIVAAGNASGEPPPLEALDHRHLGGMIRG
jgi:hypothetical protein